MNIIFKKINQFQKIAVKNKKLTVVGIIGGGLLLFMIAKIFLSLLPVIGFLVFSFIVYKIYKRFAK
jgi:hypothetical protein